MVTLVPMSQEDFDCYRQDSVPHLAQELTRARDLTDAQAMQAALASFQSLFPDGKIGARDIEVYHVVDDGQRVGVVIFGVRRDKRLPYGYVWDIFIHPQFRRRGFARQALRALEARCTALGLTTLALNVFGHNTPALALYREMGYEPESLILRKKI